MEISAIRVKELRERTGAGMMDCKVALTESQGDFEKAIELLRVKGMASASKKAGRSTKEGSVHSYIHGEGKVGVLVEINCETDFVARTDHFKTFVRDISMHIAAANPLYLNVEDVPNDVLTKEKAILIAQTDTNLPTHISEKIISNKIEKFYETYCLLKQGFVKDTSKSIDQYLKETIAKVGENVTIRRFVRFVLGEGI
jgi:elongation factor Ts